MPDSKTDVLIIGSGISGLSLALQLAEETNVTVVTKQSISEANTRYAQGGISSVLSSEDSFEAHVQDTLEAGAGLCKEAVVRLCVEEGPRAIERLVNWGVSFDRDATGDYDLGREGGHSQRRVLHAGDITGGEIERALVTAVRSHQRITVREYHHAIDLISERRHLGGLDGRCLGAYVLDTVSGSITSIGARVVVLATGGAGKVYRYTSNPDIATGDGLAMAYRLGAKVANLEFFQFHPTCLFHPHANSFLISEALRGEGGQLELEDGQRFMERYHPLGNLAPRDVVARAIDSELKRRGSKHVMLNMTGCESGFLERRFPNIFERCLSLGIDMRTQPIPVVPAAHYLCGGVLTDTHGQTTIDGLFAIGEVACTGLHGANRLASNSLLEGVVFSHRAGVRIRELLPNLKGREAPLPAWRSSTAREPDEEVIISQNWNELRHLMWNYVGIVRSDKRLARARRRIELLSEEIQEYYWDYEVSSDLLELRNLVLVAGLIVRCAQVRQESRGLHYTIDHPHPVEDLEGRDTILGHSWS